MLLRLINLKKKYLDRVVIQNLSEEFAGNIYGIVGKNGEGKTTLLKIIAGIIKPNFGNIILDPENVTIGYHSQFVEIHDLDQTIENYVISTLPKLGKMYKRLNFLESQTDQDSIEELIKLQSEFEENDGYKILSKIPTYLSNLNLAKHSPNDLVKNLSGGEKTRLQLVRLLIENPRVLLLDEPTNNLDAEAKFWLADHLKKRKNMITLVVSHDRAFLDEIAEYIFEMDEGKYKIYKGNFSEYSAEKNLSNTLQKRVYEKELRKINILKEIAVSKVSNKESLEEAVKVRGMDQAYINKKAAKGARQAKVLFDRVERKMKSISDKNIVPKEKINFHIPELPYSDLENPLIKINNLNFEYENLKLKDINLEIFYQDRIVIEGSNGSGKTTLLNLITQNLSNNEIEINEEVKISYLRQEYNYFDEEKSTLEVFRHYVSKREDDAIEELIKFEFTLTQIRQKVKHLSLGEKIRLALAIFLSTPSNLIILDEPTNHFDVRYRESLEEAVRSYEGTLICVSHDKHFLERIGVNKSYRLENGVLR